ncbi:MAG: hypothetical protein Q8922_01155 [Bacteroidota bacterium]|nr:hypothetical protein [Bacteroidota bacterium]MDP4232165.1 hypothetical protein [Bacteroidota bacterium]MDP4241127.1 hypothetical protein [Bacteroidota bacterium]MDP4286519.1 hypothetical protein [Bacteroidota bacterium]
MIRLTLRSIVVASLLVVLTASSHAQYTWKKLFTFPNAIGCGFFFDEDHGLIGSGVRWIGDSTGQRPCSIYRTSNGGQTWSTCAVPTSIYGAVSSIWMQDADTGYASIFPSVFYTDNNTFGKSSLWKTTDGGSSWFDPYHVDHAASCVYGQNGLIVLTIWDNSEPPSNFAPDQTGGDFSFDGGLNWTQGPFRRANGIAFSDSLNGVVTEMNLNRGGANHWYTLDAGRTWRVTSANQYESWSVYALPGKRIYFTANESQPGLPQQTVNWSTDGGMTWAPRYTFAHMLFTGTITGKDSVLYVQTDTTITNDHSILRGMYRSDDLGATWHFVGGPAHSRDSRFVVTGCGGTVVYAFDPFGNVWKTIDGGDGTLHQLVFPGMPKTSYEAYTFLADSPGADCRPLEGNIQFAIQGCDTTGTLDSAWMTGSPLFQISDSRSLPRPVSEDSIIVTYDPPSVPANVNRPNDTAFLHLHFQFSGKMVDTILTLAGVGPTVARGNFALQRLSVQTGGYGQDIDMPMLEILSPAANDSLRVSSLQKLNFTIAFDTTRLVYVSYAPPTGLSTVSVTPHAGTVDIVDQNSSWSYSNGDFNMGTVRFRVLTRSPSGTLITLSDLGLVTSKGGVAYPCLGNLEGNMWEVQILNTADVNPTSDFSGLSFSPSPFQDHITVANSFDHRMNVTLCDLLGRTLSSFDAPPSCYSEWPTNMLRPGMYLILWRQDGKLLSKRLTKIE